MSNIIPRKICRTLPATFAFTGFLILAAPLQQLHATSATQIKKLSTQTIEVGIASQKTHDGWIEEQHRLLEEIDDLEHSLNHIAWQRKKLQVYRQGLEGKISELRKKAAAMEAVNMDLLPILEKNLYKIKKIVAEDLPVSLSERRKSLMHAQNVLNDYDMGLLDKTRAVLDAVAKEVDLGHRVTVREDEIKIDDAARQVKTLQVGRTGLYAMTLDSEKAYRWNPEISAWIQVENHIAAIHEAIEMAEGIRLVGLSRLPMATPAPSATQKEQEK